MLRLFKKKPVQEVEEPIVSVDSIIADYNNGLNYMQLAEKYNVTVEEIAAKVGA